MFQAATKEEEEEEAMGKGERERGRREPRGEKGVRMRENANEGGQP